MLKPFGFERFLKAVNKAVGSTHQSQSSKEPTNPSSKTIFLRENKKFIQLKLDSILFLEASGNYTKVVTLNETITVREKFSDLLSSMKSEGLLQVHKSFAVAPKHIKSVEGNRIDIGEHKVPIGKVFKMNVLRILG